MGILLKSTDKLEIVIGTAADIDTQVSFMDATAVADPVVQGDTADTQVFNRTTAATHDLCTAPAASEIRAVQTVSIFNKDSADSTDVTVNFDRSTTDTVIAKASLAPGEALRYDEGLGWFETTASGIILASGAATTAQIAAHSADTYYLGIPVTASGLTRLRAGSFFFWTFPVTKGAAGTATPIFTIRFGTAGTVSDTSRCAMTMSAQTAAADSGFIVVQATFRAVGASAIIQGSVSLQHQLATTGLNSTTTGYQLVETTGGSFDSTVAGSIIGLSVNPGTSGAWVVNQVALDAVNLVF